MSWQRVYFSAMAVFLSGTIFGLVIGPSVHHFLRGDGPPPPPFGMESRDGQGMGPGPSGPPDTNEMRRHLLNRVAKELKLNKVQQAKIEPILIDLDRQMNKLRLEMQPRLAEAVDAAVNASRPVLDEVQQEKLDEHYGRLIEHWKHDRERQEREKQ